jgi:hypothetical protein
LFEPALRYTPKTSAKVKGWLETVNHFLLFLCPPQEGLFFLHHPEAMRFFPDNQTK